MLTKILLTLAVIVGAALVLRARMEQRPGVRASAPSSGRPAAKPKPPLHLRLLPYGLVLAALTIGAFFYWLEWKEEHRLFTVRVIDTRSGEVRNYPVYRHEVQGRGFRTVDGREVQLADVERMELVAAD